jgi:3-oxochol-4-en-24-oyl-CoA dehydrogenase
MTPAVDDVEGHVVAVAQDVFAKTSARSTDIVGQLGQLGLLGLGVTEDAGGSGGSVRLAGRVSELAGAAFAHGGVLHQQIAAYALACAGAERRQVAEVAYGGRTAVVAFADPASETDADGEVVELWAPFGVIGADVIDVHEGALRCLSNEVVNSSVVDRGWLNPLGGDIRIVAPRRSNTTPVDLTVVHGFARAITSVYMIGAAKSLLDQTTEYAKSRQQFGVAIGSFQAVKHRLADAEVQLMHARDTSLAALDAFDKSPVSAAALAAIAKHASGTAAQFSAEQCLQVTGGIGFTWESDVHLYLKTIMRMRQWPTPAAALQAELREAIYRDRERALWSEVAL